MLSRLLLVQRQAGVEKLLLMRSIGRAEETYAGNEKPTGRYSLFVNLLSKNFSFEKNRSNITTMMMTSQSLINLLAGLFV
jgi:hypothetical protein